MTQPCTAERIRVLEQMTGAIVNLRRPLIVLVYGLPILVVGFGILMGGYALSLATEDHAGASLYWRGAMFCLMLLAGTMVLLVGGLGICVLGRPDHDEGDLSERRDTIS